MSDPETGREAERPEEPLNEMRAQIHERLMEAQERIAHVLYKRGVSHESVLAALDAVDDRMSEEERRDDLYISAMTHFVEALGGRLEIRAVFDETEVIVMRKPDEDGERTVHVFCMHYR